MTEAENSSSQCVAIDSEMYVVEQIRGKRIANGRAEYKVKWLNWDRPEDLTWEPLENLTTVKDMVKEFEQQEQKGKGSKEKDKKVGRPKVEKIKSKKLMKLSEKAQPKIRQQDKSKPRQKSRLDSPIKKQQQAQSSSSSDSDQQSGENSCTKSLPKRPASLIGCINSIYVKSPNEVYYEVDVLNKKGECIGVRLLSSKYAKEQCKELMKEFLETYLLDEEAAAGWK